MLLFILAALSGAGIFWGLAKRKPNIILIILDALRADHLNCYGYEAPTSPFISDFASGAFIFEKVIAQSASTVPSVSSLFTSKYPYTDCLVTGSFSLNHVDMTLAEFLKTQGYATSAFVGNTFVSKKFGFDRGFDQYDDKEGRWRNADELTDAVIGFLDKKKLGGAFFLWVHYREPHSPYKPPDEYVRMFSDRGDLIQQENVPKRYTFMGHEEMFTQEDIRRFTNAYDGNIRFVDDQLKRLFGYLERVGLLRKSIVIITADHGESLGEHGIFDHNELYYGILRVPLIIKIPGVKGRRMSAPVALIDVFPTLAHLTGAREPVQLRRLRGQDIFGAENPSRELFSEYPDRTSLIVGRYRLFQNAQKKYELYDIEADPDEAIDLADKKEDLSRLLQKKTAFFWGSSSCFSSDDRVIIKDEEIKENIRSLGYAQ